MYKIFNLTDRVGGRTVGQTLKAASGTETWDLGGQWVGRYMIRYCYFISVISFNINFHVLVVISVQSCFDYIVILFSCCMIAAVSQM